MTSDCSHLTWDELSKCWHCWFGTAHTAGQMGSSQFRGEVCCVVGSCWAVSCWAGKKLGEEELRAHLAVNVADCLASMGGSQ